MELASITDPSVCLHVGDDYSCDIVGAANAGWKSILIASDETQVLRTSIVESVRVKDLEELYTACKRILEESYCVCFPLFSVDPILLSLPSPVSLRYDPLRSAFTRSLDAYPPFPFL